MAAINPEYELILMLDPEAPDARRDEIAAEARGRIESAGTLKHDDAWGMRNMAYEIRQRTEADYRFFRFESPSSLLDELDHNLKIADGVLRFRIFKVDSRAPAMGPPPPTAGVTARRRAAPGGEPPGEGVEAPAAEVAEPAPAAEPAEPPGEEPATAEPEPEAAEPEATEPEAAEPEVAEPEPEAAEPEE